MKSDQIGHTACTVANNHADGGHPRLAMMGFDDIGRILDLSIREMAIIHPAAAIMMPEHTRARTADSLQDFGNTF